MRAVVKKGEKDAGSGVILSKSHLT